MTCSNNHKAISSMDEMIALWKRNKATIFFSSIAYGCHFAILQITLEHIVWRALHDNGMLADASESSFFVTKERADRAEYRACCTRDVYDELMSEFRK